MCTLYYHSQRVNICLEEFCNIGKLVNFKRVLNVCRGSNIFCQLIVQSIPQISDRYPQKEWEELIGCADVQIALGCNDNMTAEYLSKKCGYVTVQVENNQMPMMPLFSPIYSSTRPYSQTKSNTQRALLLPDEIQRMDNQEALIMLRGQKPLKIYKITPEEHPCFKELKDVRVGDHIPEWRKLLETPPERPPEPPPAKTPVREPPQPAPASHPAAPEAPADAYAAPTQPESAAEAPRQSSRPAWCPGVDYTLVSHAQTDETAPTPASAQAGRYGALDPIEVAVEDVYDDQPITDNDT